MAFFFFDYAKMVASLEKEVSDAIQDINRECQTSLMQASPAELSSNKFIPDYLINRDGVPFLIIERKSQLTSLSESIFAKGLSEWGTYGIMTDGEEYKVYGRKSYKVIATYRDLKSAIKYLLDMPKQDVNIRNNKGIELVCDFIKESARLYLPEKSREEIVKLAEKWKKSSDSLFEEENGTYVFKNETELSLFKILLGKCDRGDKLCRYCSWEALFRILTNKKYYLNNILNMNDKTEGAYFERQISPTDSDDNMLVNRLDYFIMSCSSIEKMDDFDMWRLYGDDAKGCCMVFEIIDDSNSDFRIFPISYGCEDGGHPEVDFLNHLTIGNPKLVITNLNEWKLFFKPFEYHNEKEVRILRCCGHSTVEFKEEYFMNGLYGIGTKCLAYDLANFPVVLDGIVIGPDFHEKEANVTILEELLGRIKDRKIIVSESKHKSYRSLK